MGKKNVCVCVCVSIDIWLIHFAVHLKVIQHYKSTNKIKKKKKNFTFSTEWDRKSSGEI